MICIEGIPAVAARLAAASKSGSIGSGVRSRPPRKGQDPGPSPKRGIAGRA